MERNVNSKRTERHAEHRDRNAEQSLFSVDPVFANNSWAGVVTACRRGNVPSAWAVGDSMLMTIGGVDYQVDIIGKSHDDYADGSGKAPRRSSYMTATVRGTA